MTRHTKKLIEVALPLQWIHRAAAREAILHGHPFMLHPWWARQPLTVARSLLFAQMVDDPSSQPELFPTQADQERERQRLFQLIEELVVWKNSSNPAVLNRAREEIKRSWRIACARHADHPQAAELFDPERLPGFHDPFAGGGSLPLEAQRLGLEAYASDVDPVAVLINKAMIEIPPRFANRPPVHPAARQERRRHTDSWVGMQGMAEDVRRYGIWMREQAEKRIGHLYPRAKITAAVVQDRPDLRRLEGQELTVIAWLWARTVKSSHPAFAEVEVPLVSTFILSSIEGKESHVEPVVEGNGYRFMVRLGEPPAAAERGTRLARGSHFRCLMSGAPLSGDYIKEECKAGRMGVRLMAIVAESDRSRIYLPPLPEHEAIAQQAHPSWKPETAPLEGTQYLEINSYGVEPLFSRFSSRQWVAMETFSDLARAVGEPVKRDALMAGFAENFNTLSDNGDGHIAYAEAISVYLACSISRAAYGWSQQTAWQPGVRMIAPAFTGRAVRSMPWNYYAERNPFSDAGDRGVGSYVVRVAQAIRGLIPSHHGHAEVHDARQQTTSTLKVVATDPPCHDDIPYAELSDFSRVWLGRSLGAIYPDLFSSFVVPQSAELVALSSRHGNTENSEAFFVEGMRCAMRQLAQQVHPHFPVTICYHFKQSEQNVFFSASRTGWEMLLDAVVGAGLAIVGTWPIRTACESRMPSVGSTGLASRIVLVCRPRPFDAYTATREQFQAALKSELQCALAHLQLCSIAPMDLAQAAIGPGMSVYTRFSEVIAADNKRVAVREALAMIDQSLDEVLSEQEGNFDAGTRWALSWFEQCGFNDGAYGEAEILSTTKGVCLSDLVEAGILASKADKVRLLRPNELPADWKPAPDTTLIAWKMLHHLVMVLKGEDERPVSQIFKQLGTQAEVVRELAYHLYILCERKKRTAEALVYNTLVQNWLEMVRLSREPHLR
ncbi:MAG: DUF1156 domain-containing protein [Magnetococcales bacterium]|nr:DUF1156 domain-containing protein [Magnetococcales bacterium]